MKFSIALDRQLAAGISAKFSPIDIFRLSGADQNQAQYIADLKLTKF